LSRAKVNIKEELTVTSFIIVQYCTVQYVEPHNSQFLLYTPDLLYYKETNVKKCDLLSHCITMVFHMSTRPTRPPREAELLYRESADHFEVLDEYNPASGQMTRIAVDLLTGVILFIVKMPPIQGISKMFTYLNSISKRSFFVVYADSAQYRLICICIVAVLCTGLLYVQTRIMQEWRNARFSGDMEVDSEAIVCG